MKHYHKNPRQITKKEFADLRDSLRKFGDLSGIVHNLNTDEIISGNQRIEVFDLSTLQIEITERLPEPDEQGTVATGWVVWEGKRYIYRAVMWDEKQAEEANIRANKAGGSWNFDVLANNFDVPDLLEWGFSERELQLGGFDLDQPKAWRAEDQDEVYANLDGDGIEVIAGYRLGSMWYGMTSHNEVRKFMLDLPQKEGVHDGATVKLKYSRTNAEETERIVKTYMRPGDYFFEMCCGWVTFSSTAKYFGFSGKGGDIWDVSLDFCKQQIKAMPGAGKVDVIYADCRDTKEPDNHYDFVHSNPPFFSLEPYGDSDKDLASSGSYELWLDAMGDMGKEAERILKPGGLANFVINDFRKNGIVIPMHADFINSILKKSSLVLHDLVVAEVISQALRFRKHDYERQRTVKCHEYIITFKKSGGVPELLYNGEST